MLSQPGKNTANNLQRTKSTTSVKDRRKHPLLAEPTDPQTAKTHALIAAHRAFDRSRASNSTEVTRSESVISKTSAPGCHEQNLRFSPASHLRKQRSTLQTRVPKLADTIQIPSEVIQFSTCGNTEFGLRGETYGAEPSSYRKLRRSRSLLTPVRQVRGFESRSPETPVSQVRTLRTTASSVALRSPGLKLRLKRSLNFLRQHRNSKERVITAPALLQSENPHWADPISLADNHGLLDSPRHQKQQELSTKPSLSFSSNAKQIQRSLREKFRIGEGKSITAIRGQSEDGMPAPKVHKRKMTTSISQKLGRVFSKSTQAECLPPQQLEASRPHFDVDFTKPNPEAGFDRYLDYSYRSTIQESPHVPSNYNSRTCDYREELSQRLNKSGSCDSLSSNSKSRNTSWTNSTATDLRPAKYEPKRLSVIKEDGGPHQPSSSAGRHIGGVSLFRQPLNIPQGQTIDSQRVYSALMKRIDEEQKEMEQTKAALKEIHDAQEQDDVVGHYLFSAPTIRRVSSKGSLSLPDIAEDCIATSDGSLMCNASQRPSVESQQQQQHHGARMEKALVRKIDQSNSDHSLRQILAGDLKMTDCLDENQTSYPISSTEQEGAVETSSILIQRCQPGKHLDRSRFSQSTESVYSRTTNGGTNLDYMSPIGSMEDLRQPTARYIGSLNNPQPTVSDDSVLDQRNSSFKSLSGGTKSDKGPWKDWMEHQLETVNSRRPRSRPIKHFREHAQIDSEDTDVGHGNSLANSARLQSDLTKLPQCGKPLKIGLTNTISPNAVHEPKSSSSLLPQFKEVRSTPTPAPSRNSSIRRSQSVLLNQTNESARVPARMHKESGVRKISASNVAQMLKSHKSQPALVGQSKFRKENTPIRTGNQLPVSSPGQNQPYKQTMGRTRQFQETSSATGMIYKQSDGVSRDQGTSCEDSMFNKPKDELSARLSRPFDMDIPNHNRPFDSTYLGKRETENGNRLSVAPGDSVVRRPKTYGNLGPVPFGSNNSSDEEAGSDSEPTALPSMTLSNNLQRSTSGLSIGLAGKRLVSNFLRGRKGQIRNSDISRDDDSAFI